MLNLPDFPAGHGVHTIVAAIVTVIAVCIVVLMVWVAIRNK